MSVIQIASGLVLVLASAIYFLVNFLDIRISTKPIEADLVPVSWLDELVMTYRNAVTINTPAAQALARDAAYWLAWHDRAIPEMDWLDWATDEERLELGALCTRLEGDPWAVRRSIELKGSISRRQQDAEREQEEAERRAEILAAAAKRPVPPEHPHPRHASGVVDDKPLYGPHPMPFVSVLLTHLAESLAVPEERVVPSDDGVFISDQPFKSTLRTLEEQHRAAEWIPPEPMAQECEHVWHNGRCRACGADLIPCVCELDPRVLRHAAEIGRAQIYRDSCPRCSPEDWAWSIGRI